MLCCGGRCSEKFEISLLILLYNDAMLSVGFHHILYNGTLTIRLFPCRAQSSRIVRVGTSHDKPASFHVAHFPCDTSSSFIRGYV